MSDNSVPQLAKRQRRGLPVLVTLLILALIAGIIAGILSSRSGEAPPELTWTPIDGGLEETILKTPVDHDAPGGETLDLRILRRPADDPAQRIGSLLGNTGDPATPFASTESMVASLASAVLVTIESNNHGGYGTNECVNETVHRYLIDLTMPEVGTRCS